MRLIDADALIVMEFEGIRFVPAEFIEDAEVIEERKKGEWIFEPKDAIELMFTKPKCSKCGYESADGGNFCSNCGADMRGENNG